MLIILFFMVTILEFCLTQTPAQTALKYCNTINCKPGESIACQFKSNSGMKCKGQLQKLDPAFITNLHNQKRNTIALGKISGFDTAVDMATMKWNTELAQMAKYNVMTCKFGHDKCRNTNNFKMSGQNLYMKYGTGLDNLKINDLITEGINAWFNEYKICKMDLINNFESSGLEAGHFTAMVRNTNSNFGCAVNKFTENGKLNFLLACNYETTNIINTPIYEAGPTASKCKNGKNTMYPGLCKV